jgi:hypothetical protein
MAFVIYVTTLPTLKDKLNGNKTVSFVFFKETNGLSFRLRGASEFELCPFMSDRSFQFGAVCHREKG